MLAKDTITFESIMKLALIIHQSTYPELKLEDNVKLLNISSRHGTDNPYSFLEKEYLTPVPYSVKPLNLYKLYSTLKDNILYYYVWG